MSAPHWRETCHIKSFTVPFDAESYKPSISFTFLSKEFGFQNDTYKCVGALMLNGWPVRAKYERCAKGER